ncbi:inactive protein RESTRICTED TEV MOVEMENT 2-like [Lycium ferocissimum]|uniref:inactive protein RESTRICTED TEV MOVEMENT 2-like n=1 Tax=Lycium ferocissimum TaxID=112874 RepID=UPI002814A6BE|nr:inactive protein RESTRICTED TEV MOVEMENT 2-like [Lycium ferocissimum]
MENGYKDSCSRCSDSRIYEDFVPSSEVVHGKDYDTLLLNLPGFKKEEVKVQLCKSTGILKISGQRPVNKLLSFQKEIPVSTNCDKSKISAKLVNGILYIKHPKLIIRSSSKKKDKELPPSTSEPEQDHKTQEMNTSRNEINEQENAENIPAKEEAKEEPKTREKTQVKPHDQSIKDNTMRTTSDLFEKLKGSRQVINISLAALVVLGIGRYVINVMSSPKKAKE